MMANDASKVLQDGNGNGSLSISLQRFLCLVVNIVLAVGLDFLLSKITAGPCVLGSPGRSASARRDR